MNKIAKFIIRNCPFVIALVLLALPVFSFAAGLVPCDNVSTPCDFTAFMTLVHRVINFILFDMAIPVAAIMFCYAGFLMVTAGGGEAKTKAKSIFTNAFLGLVLAAGAWVIVRTVLLILGYNGAWIGFPK